MRKIKTFFCEKFPRLWGGREEARGCRKPSLFGYNRITQPDPPPRGTPPAAKRAPSRPPTLPRRWRRAATLYRAVAKSSADGSRPVVVRRHQIDDGVDRAALRRRARLQHGLESLGSMQRRRHRATGRCSRRRSRCGLVRRSPWSPRSPTSRVAPTRDRSASARPTFARAACSRPRRARLLGRRRARRTADDKARRRSGGLRAAARPRSLDGPRAPWRDECGCCARGRSGPPASGCMRRWRSGGT